MQALLNSRYKPVAIFLHWSMALVIAALLISGLIIGNDAIQKVVIANDSQLFTLFQWHKSFGVTALLLITLRIIWRVLNKPPVLTGLSNKEQKRASLGHKAVYLLLIIMPLSGWLMVSSSQTGIPTILFNLVKWPHLPTGTNQLINIVAHNVHYYIAWLLFISIVGHIVMVLVHAKQGHHFLTRMKPSKLTLASISFLVIVLIALSTLTNHKQQIQQLDANAASQASLENIIQFSGVHADQPFNGVFKKWSVDSDFNPSKQQLSTFKLTIETASAYTGDEFYDETLIEEDWFNTEEFPLMTFIANTVESINKGEYKVSGKLIVKDVSYPLTTILKQSNKALTAELNLSRLSIGLGVDADPDAEWVDDNIVVKALWQSK